jgi:hypothetical protein
MAASDLTLSIFIIIMFILLYFFNIYAVGTTHIKDNWPIYRCQPVMMPFASLFGHDTGQNFAYCIQNIQTNFMGDLLKPVNLNLSILGNITSGMTDNLNFTRGFMSDFRFNLEGVHLNIFATMYNIMIEVQRMVINITDMMQKLLGVIITLMYVLDGSMMTMTSMWKGPPGKLIRALCFHPETKVTLKNGEIFAMKDLPLNSILPNGSRVCAVMQISNLDETGDYVEPMFRVKTRAGADDILVSGSHLVYDPAATQFVHVKDLAAAEKSETDCAVLSCLITTDHTIQLGEWLFHDWEDSNGSESKNIGSH